jgi:hypothetical protein
LPRHEPWLPETGPARQEDEVQDEKPPVIERNANGLPQRRRRTPSPDARPGGIPARNSATPQPPSRPAADEPAPGLWMADLQSGLSGDSGKSEAEQADEANTTDDNAMAADRDGDTSSDEGE